MKREELIQALDCLKVQTGSLACLGCGYEHNCATKGCRILREAAEQLSAPVIKTQESVIKTRAEILEAAGKCVTGGRDEEYGEPEDSFDLIARLWEPYIRAVCVSPSADVTIRPQDVAILMALLKIARAAVSDKPDNFVDLAGYAACAGEVAQSAYPMPPIGKCKECVHWDEDDSQGFKRLGNYVCICRKWSDHENGIRKYTGEGDCCKSFKRKKKELS